MLPARFFQLCDARHAQRAILLNDCVPVDDSSVATTLGEGSDCLAVSFGTSRVFLHVSINDLGRVLPTRTACSRILFMAAVVFRVRRGADGNFQILGRLGLALFIRLDGLWSRFWQIFQSILPQTLTPSFGRLFCHFCHPYPYQLPLQVAIVQLLDSLCSALRCGEFNETIAQGPPALRSDDLGSDNITNGAHMILEILCYNFDGKAVYKDAVLPLALPLCRRFRRRFRYFVFLRFLSFNPFILFHANRPTLQIGIVQLFDGLFGPFGRGEFNVAQAQGPSTLRCHNLGVDDIASSAHVINELLRHNFEGKVADGNAVLFDTCPPFKRSLLHLCLFFDIVIKIIIKPFGLIYANFTSLQISIVQLFYGLLSGLRRSICDCAPAQGSSIGHREDLGVDDFADSAHVILEIL
mmetsp:Transcript_5598/g.12194  ORF Transcript_5598/g.12194 Transcript_5598/m.12194 type:complete len:410 (+) Transcript_5598:1182-2411(+)